MRAAPSASCRALLSPDTTRRATSRRIRAEYRKVADAHARGERDKQRLPLAKARANALQIDWAAYAAAAADASSARASSTSYDLAELVPYIDWTPFFQTWELKGRYPAILDDPRAGRGGARSSSTTRRPC